MKSSETVNELFDALSQAQGEFPVVPKNRTGKIQTKSGGEYSYFYADQSDIVSAVQPILSKFGLAVIQLPCVTDEGREGLSTRLGHKSGQWVEEEMRLLIPENLPLTPQLMGSSITYGKRYAYCAVLGIQADTDDDGHLAEVAYGADSAKVRRRSAPKASTPTTGRRQPIAQDPTTAGLEGMSAKDRNKIISHLSRLDPPIRGDAVALKVAEFLGSTEPVAMAKLSVEDGAKVFKALGIEP